MKNPLTLKAFADWCDTKPANEQYEWSSEDNCACAQYATHLGRTDDWRNRHRDPKTGAKTFLAKISGGAACEGPLTFGALAVRLRSASRER